MQGVPIRFNHETGSKEFQIIVLKIHYSIFITHIFTAIHQWSFHTANAHINMFHKYTILI